MRCGKKKQGIICFEGNWHGRTMGAQLMGGNTDQKKWIGYQDPNIYHLPFPYPWSLKNVTGETFFWDSIKELEKKGDHCKMSRRFSFYVPVAQLVRGGRS